MIAAHDILAIAGAVAVAALWLAFGVREPDQAG
jgi:hypothetical protein